MPYNSKQRAAILSAVKVAREEGTWEDALKSAHGAGFKGSPNYLRKFVAAQNKHTGMVRRRQRSVRAK